MSPAAPVLAEPSLPQISASREILALETAFRCKDGEATDEQRRLFRLLGTTNLLVLAVGVLSGLVLAGALAADRWPDWRLAIERASWACGLAIVACGILATVMGQFVRGGDRLGRWRALRSEAELARGRKYAALARLAAAAGPGPALEALEAVGEELLEHQRAFYERRARRHRTSAGVTSIWTGVALALSSLAGAAAVTVLVGLPTQWLLVIGVIGAAVGAYAVDRENLQRDRGNAELYERTAERLGALAGGLDRVAAEVQGGTPQAVVVFTDLVVEELQAEHRRWVEVLNVTQEQLNRLDDRLREARARASQERAAAGNAAQAAAGPRPVPAAPPAGGASTGEVARNSPSGSRG